MERIYGLSDQQMMHEMAVGDPMIAKMIDVLGPETDNIGAMLWLHTNYTKMDKRQLRFAIDLLIARVMILDYQLGRQGDDESEDRRIQVHRHEER